MVERLFLAVLRGSLQFVIVVSPDHTHLLFICWISLLLSPYLCFISFLYLDLYDALIIVKDQKVHVTPSVDQ